MGALDNDSPTAGLGELKMFSGARFPFCFFADRCWGFKRFAFFLLTGAGVLRDANDYGCSRLGFYEMLLKTPAYSCKVEKVLLKPQQITAK